MDPTHCQIPKPQNRQVQADILMVMMMDYVSWEKFVRNVCGNLEDIDMQVVLLNMSRLVDLSQKNFYESLMEVPFIINHAVGGMPDDGTALETSLAELGRVLAYRDFVEPVKEALKRSNEASLVAIQHSVAALVVFRADAEGSGVLSCDDGTRKFRKVDNILQQELLCTVFAYLSKNAVGNFWMVAELVRPFFLNVGLDEIESEKSLARLQTTHRDMQEMLLQELTCSKNVFTRVVSVVEKAPEAIGLTQVSRYLYRDV